jgi:hypothetical protein
MDLYIHSPIRLHGGGHSYLSIETILTEMSTRNIKQIMFLGSKVLPVRGADKRTAIYKPIF